MSTTVSRRIIYSLRCPRDDMVGPELPTERTAKTLIRLGGCKGWSESSLGEQFNLSDWADAQAYLCLLWALRYFCLFCRTTPHSFFDSTYAYTHADLSLRREQVLIKKYFFLYRDLSLLTYDIGGQIAKPGWINVHICPTHHALMSDKSR